MNRYLDQEELEFVRQAGYNEYGLKHSIEELKTVVPDVLTLEEFAKYADAITYAKVHKNDVSFFAPQLLPIPSGKTVTVTATGLGNLAYIALHMKDVDTRTKATLLFQQIISNYPQSNVSHS